MAVAAPSDAYVKMIKYGEKKAALRWDQLLLQSFLAGYWVAVYGHALTNFAGTFYTPGDRISSGIATGIWGLLFPGAFVALVYTGAELFTGNTVTMVLVVCQKGRKSLKNLCRVWGLSLLGNLAGTLFGAFFFSALSKQFSNNSGGQVYLFSLAEKKISRNFGSNFVLAIACNSLVCLATWCTVCSEDGAGKILAIFYCISIFVVGGYEHIIANMWTLSAAIFCGYEKHNFGQIIVNNWIPVFIGNVLAGTLFTGILWWYALHPEYTDLAAYSEVELARELSQRYAASDNIENGGPEDKKYTIFGPKDEKNKQQRVSKNSRWRNSIRKNKKFGSIFEPHHLCPATPQQNQDLFEVMPKNAEKKQVDEDNPETSSHV